MSKPISYFSKQIFLLNVLFRKNISHHKVFYSDHASNSIDSFTDMLVLEKGLKWENLLKVTDKYPTKPFLKSCINKIEDENIIKKKKVSGEELIENINECAKLNNIPQLIINLEICQNENNCPTKEQLIYLAKLFTINKNKRGIKILQHLCKVNYPSEYRTQSRYDHFIAEVIWTEGNVKDSLNLFGNVYCENVGLRRQIKIMLCNRFSEVVTNHGEASRIIATNFVKTIANKHGDYSLMGYFWKVLFESEWFSDQQLSATFLMENNQLKNVIGWMLPMMGRQLLQEHKIDTFYRLIENLLSNDMKQHCGPMLRLLFDYKCKYVIVY